MSALRNSDWLTTDDLQANALRTVLEFTKIGIYPVERGDGLWQIGKFILSMKKRSFRVDGKWTWYKWGSPKAFLKKYGDGKDE